MEPNPCGHHRPCRLAMHRTPTNPFTRIPDARPVPALNRLYAMMAVEWEFAYWTFIDNGGCNDT